MDSRFREHSRIIIDGPSRAPARSYFRAVGFSDADLQKPMVGIANTWIETMPCNSHLRHLAEKVKEGVRAAGGTPMEFNTIAISDGETMGTDGMRASLVSREVIADSIELVGRGYMFDAMVALAGCDKTIPGTAMGLTRLNLPSLVLYGGSIQPGQIPRPRRNDSGRVRSGWRALRRQNHRRRPEGNRKRRVSRAPARAAANSRPTPWRWRSNSSASLRWDWAMFLPPIRARTKPPIVPARWSWTCFARASPRARSSRARRSKTRFPLSWLPAARPTPSCICWPWPRKRRSNFASRNLTKSARRTPLLADMKPWGRFTAVDLYNAGGMALLAKRLLDAGLLHRGQITASLKTLDEEALTAKEQPGQEVVRPLVRIRSRTPAA